MLASILIIAISGVLFVYWFRYTCILILSTKTSKDYARQVAAANRLEFVEVQGALSGSGGVELDPLARALDRDYAIVNQLLEQTAGLEMGGATMEHHMLRLNFHAMQAWYRVSRRVSESSARSALHEMALVVGHFANAFGEMADEGAGA
jgi:hypothetical protein